MISSAAAIITRAFSSGNTPSARFTAAAARLTSASARISSGDGFSVEILKFRSERCVCAPQARRGDGDFSKGIVLKTCGFHHSGSISSCVDAYFILTLYLILKNKGGDYDAVFLLPILKRSQSVCDDNSLRQLSRL